MLMERLCCVKQEVEFGKTNSQNFTDSLCFDTISELKKGLEFGILLKLPSSLSCNQHLCELVVKDQDEELRPFLHLS